MNQENISVPQKKSNIIIKIFVVIGFITGILALIISFTPLNMISFAPALIALITGGIAFLLTKRIQGKKLGSLIVLGMAVLSMLIGGISEMLVEDVVEEDKQFEAAVEASVDSVDADLIDALDDLNMIVDESEEFIND